MHVRNSRLCRVLVSLAASLLVGILPALTFTAESAAQEIVKVPRWNSPFAWKVHGVLRPTGFKRGDRIEIEEVLSEQGTLAMGQTVIVRGTYTLASRDRATLLLSITHDPRRGPQPGCVMERPIERGTEQFELELPMAVYGQLHISFYAGSSFGNVYFSPGRSYTHQEVEIPERESLATEPVDFTLGSQEYGYHDKRDRIEIQEVRSELGTLEKGDTVRVKGTYTLASRRVATLLFSISKTRGDFQGGCTIERPVRAGTVPFDLEMPVGLDGPLHIGLHDINDDRDSVLTNVYFGTQKQMRRIGQ